MRKQLPILYAVLFVAIATVFALSIAGCSDEDVPTASTMSDEEIAQNTRNSTPVAASPTVYITNTGTKYHKSGCRYLSQSKIAISKKDAIAQGYGACSVCKP